MEATSILRTTFRELLTSFRCEPARADELWHDLLAQYSAPNRHYHNIRHLESLYHHLLEVKDHIEDWDAILFSMFYHDYVYDVLKSDNEERSAEHAASVMDSLGVPLAVISRCRQQILSTKRHESSTDIDTNLFTDTDLSILGASLDEYSSYTKNIRMEYDIYSDATFYLGRKSVLLHVLGMGHIFKTDPFQHRFESQARANIRDELRSIDDFLAKQRTE